MTATTFKKYRTFTYDEKGKPVAVQLDLRNKHMRTFFEEMMEDLEDTVEAMARDDEEGRPFDEFVQELSCPGIS